MMAVRCTQPLLDSTRKKISMFSNVTSTDVFSCHDVPSIFSVPQILYEQGIVDKIFTKFNKVGMINSAANWDKWNNIVNSMQNKDGEIKIAMVGKYVTLTDSYVSVNHALKHAAAKIGKSVSIDWIDSEEINGKVNDLVKYNGILVPGGFGSRGAEGIIKTANFAREKNIPYLGICFGFQLAAVAFGRHVLNYSDANSTELDPKTSHPVVDLLPEQKTVSNMGGSLRLGAHDITIKTSTIAYKAYNASHVSRRHRHRYEINTKYLPEFEKHGLVFSAESDNSKRMEMLEIPSHKFYFGVQFHPEFNSRPGFPEESFEAFIHASAS